MSDSHRDLIAWQKAVALVTNIYESTRSFPREEMYGLTNQLRRAAVSISSNIAEGKGRMSKKEYVQFLSRARGSLLEVDTQLTISRNLRYLAVADFERLITEEEEVGKVLNGLINSVLLQIEAAPDRIRDADVSYPES